MTLVSVTWTPFPFVADSLHTGLVFAADTRYTYSDDRPPYDRGIKLAQVGSHAACGWAGRVDAGASILPYLTSFFQKNPRPSVDHEATNDALKECLNLADSDTHQVGNGYSLVVGFLAEDGQPALFVRGPRSQLVDQRLRYGAAIGDRRAIVDFQGRHRQAAIDMISFHHEYRPEARSWVVPAASALQGIIEDITTPTIGGGLQVGYLDESGFHQMSVDRGRETGEGQIGWVSLTPSVTLD